MPLNARQQRFVQEYLIDPNATQAAVKAGYSPKTAAVQAHDLLRKPNVMAELNAMQAEVAGKLNLTIEAVLAGVMGTTLEAREAQEFAACLKGYELLGKHLKMWTDKQELTGDGGGPIRVISDL